MGKLMRRRHGCHSGQDPETHCKEKEVMNCPIPGCRKTWRTISGLEAHLYRDHRKADLVKWILDQIEA